MTDPSKDQPDETAPASHEQARIGADLIYPLAGAAFGVYYLWSIAEIPWMAQFNGFFLVSILAVLIVLLILRNARDLTSGRARFSFADLAETPTTAILRWGVFGLAVAFVLTIEFFGFTLSILLFLLLSMTLLGVRPWSKLIAVAVGMSAMGYVLFIVALGARLPRGPIENLLSGLF
jgi:hypothetical protein